MEDYSGGFSIRSSRGGGGGGGTGTKCGRWNPTSEQVKVLTELFRSGLRTPSTDQIQKISSQLSYYGKIESKNVFYWFQNHKARERQKRRRVLVDEGNDIFHTTPHVNSTTTKVSSTKYFSEIHQVSEPAERVLETLQLFPINSFNDPSTEKFNLYRGNCKGNSTSFAYNITNTEMESHHYHHHHHPKLDLRLSFV